MHHPSILIFNRDVKYLASLTQQFHQAQFQVKTHHHPGDVLRCLQEGTFDLLMLDVCPAALHGIDLLEEIRRMHGAIPILVLTADPDLHTAIQALRHQVRDYLTAPIPFTRLHARVCEILADIEEEIRRKGIINQMQTLLDQFRNFNPDPSPAPTSTTSPPPPTHLVQHGPCTVNLTTREVTLCGHSFLLSPTEFNYWLTLLRHAPDLLTHKNLVLEAQGYELSNQEAMDMARWHIHELRKTFKARLEKDPIQTIRGVGYCLNL